MTESVCPGGVWRGSSRDAKAARRSFDAADLVGMDMADPAYIVRPWIAEGVTLVCGRPKVGKTTLLRALCLAANRGGLFLAQRAVEADVLFLSLEEGERIMRKKLRGMVDDPEQLRGIRFEFEWPQGAEGVKLLREWLLTRTSERPPVVIIDSLTRFRPTPRERANVFVEDYNAVKLLADLAKEFEGLAVVCLHHTTKAIPDDPVSAISGSYGLSAAADSFLIMLKQGDAVRLHGGGRLWESETTDFEIAHSAGSWALVGTFDTTASLPLGPKQREVLDKLRSGAKTNKTLMEATGQSKSAISQTVTALAEKKLIVRVANGWGLVS